MGCLDRIRRCFGHKVKNEDSIQYSQIDVNTSKLREEEDDEDLAWDDFEDFEESPTEITSYTSNAEHTHDMKNSSKHEHVAIDMNRLQDARAASSSLKSRPKAMVSGW